MKLKVYWPKYPSGERILTTDEEIAYFMVVRCEGYADKHAIEIITNTIKQIREDEREKLGVFYK